MRSKAIFHAVLGVSALVMLGESARADIFVYQIPGGSRIVTDHPLNNRDYRLVRQSRDSKGAGTLISGRKIQYAVTDPAAYDRLIQRTASAHEVDAALIKAVMHIESAFNPHAVSDKGAMGLMQVMPDTAKRYGVEDLFDPVQNVRAGALYLKDLQKLFKNNTRLVLAAYNAGENAVLRHKGMPPYDETQDYVRKVMKVHREYSGAQQAKNAQKATPAIQVAALVPAPVSAAKDAKPMLIPAAAVRSDSSAPVEKNL